MNLRNWQQSDGRVPLPENGLYCSFVCKASIKNKKGAHFKCALFHLRVLPYSLRTKISASVFRQKISIGPNLNRSELKKIRNGMRNDDRTACVIVALLPNHPHVIS